MSTYSVNNIPDGFKVHIKISAILNLIDWDHNCKLKLEISLGKRAKQTMSEVKRKENLSGWQEKH